MPSNSITYKKKAMKAKKLHGGIRFHQLSRNLDSYGYGAEND